MVDSREPRGTTKARRESEVRLQSLLSSLDDLVLEFDENGTYLGIWTTNDARPLAPRSELVGRTHAEAIGGEIGLKLKQIIGRVLKSGRPETLEYCLEAPAGTRWFQGRVAPIVGSEGPSRRICLLVRDITAQKEAEQEISRLLSRERLLSRLPEALPVGLFEIDMAGHVTFTNDRMYTIAGQVPAATMEGLMPSVVAEDRPVLESALGAVLADQPVDDLYLGLRPAVADTPLTSGTKRVCALSLRAH